MAKSIKYPIRPPYPYSVFKPISAGFFRQRIVIQTPVLSRRDGQGGYNEQWADLATVWGRIETIKDSASGNIEKFEEMQIKYQQHYSVTIRWGQPKPILTSYRLLYTSIHNNNETKVLAIVAVVNLDVVNWQVNLYCREGGNIG
jgi:head-tail adaptor